MQLPLYSQHYLGIHLMMVPGAARAQTQLADAEFWRSLYDMVGEGQGVAEDGLRTWKGRYGQMLLDSVIDPWIEKTGRQPRILSIGAGFGFSERPWLAAGHDVTLNEFSLGSLQEIKHEFPEVKLLEGDLRGRIVGKRFDVIAALGLNGALSNKELASLLANLKELLAPDGLVIVDQQGSLSYVQMAKEVVKRVIGRYRTPHVFMAWFRTPGVLTGLASAAGLRTIEAYSCFARRNHPSLQRRPRLLAGLPTLSNTHVALLMRHQEGAPSG